MLRYIFIFLFLALPQNSQAGFLEECSAYFASMFGKAKAGTLEAAQMAAQVDLPKIFLLRENGFLKNLTVATEDWDSVKAIFTKHTGVNNFSSTRYLDLVNESFAAVHARIGISDVEKGALLSAVAKDLEPFIKKLPLQDQKSVRYALGMAVNRLESFKPHEYKIISESARFIFPKDKKNLAHYDQFHDYVRGYLKQEEPYSGISGGLLGLVDIRNMESYNRWPIYMDPHDVKHVHYAIGHPRTMAVMLSSARSKNHKRYGLLSALFEGVDTVQYSRETALAKYFKNRGMDTEEAMLYLSHASDEEMDFVMRESGAESDLKSYIETFKDWTPTASHVDDFKGRSGMGLDYDMDEMVLQFEAKNSSGDAEIQRMIKYSNNPQRGGDNWGSAENIETLYHR